MQGCEIAGCDETIVGYVYLPLDTKAAHNLGVVDMAHQANARTFRILPLVFMNRTENLSLGVGKDQLIILDALAGRNQVENCEFADPEFLT